MSVDIVNLIESNPITQFSGDYQSKLVEKVKNNFTNYEQQLFLSSFYCYLKYDSKKDYVIDLDNIWKWLGFSQKDACKRVIEKNFLINKDYKIFAPQVGEAKKETRGGHNKEIIMLNIETFKKFCLHH
jgi:intein/homing endonuclease